MLSRKPHELVNQNVKPFSDAEPYAVPEPRFPLAVSDIITARKQARLLVILLLFLLLDDSLGNTVQITLTRLGDAAATLLLVLLQNADLLESLEDLAVNATAGIDVYIISELAHVS
jgi:hypothetical protein